GLSEIRTAGHGGLSRLAKRQPPTAVPCRPQDSPYRQPDQKSHGDPLHGAELAVWPHGLARQPRGVLLADDHGGRSLARRTALMPRTIAIIGGAGAEGFGLARKKAEDPEAGQGAGCGPGGPPHQSNL